jgi:fucose 4-O-acetylase-like acetyltransferase
LRKILASDWQHLMFFLLLGIVSIYLSNKGWTRNEYLLMISRTMIGMMFYYFGYFYKLKIEGKFNIFNGRFLFLSLLIISVMTVFVPDLYFGFGAVDFRGRIFVPIITSIIGIYISILIARALDFIIKDRNDLLHMIGRNSVYIMFFHFLIFFIISFLYFKINHISEYYYSSLAQFPYCPSPVNLDILWPLYICFGLLIPTFYGELVSRFKNARK